MLVSCLNLRDYYCKTWSSHKSELLQKEKKTKNKNLAIHLYEWKNALKKQTNKKKKQKMI